MVQSFEIIWWLIGLVLDFPMSSPLCKIHSGSGRISVALHAGKAVISDLACTYPLKLLSPSTHNDTAMVYMMTYGGGLVGGDAIDLNVNVEAGAKLVLLSQVCESFS